MKKDWLLPSYLQLPGWLILIPSVAFGLFLVFSYLPDWNGISTAGFVYNEITIITTTIGFLMVGFSRLKREDEYTSALRLDALFKACYLHFALLIAGSLIWYGTDFIIVMFFLFFSVPLLYLLILGIGLWRGTRITRPLLLPHRFRRIGRWMMIFLTLPALYLLLRNIFGPESSLLNNIAIITMSVATVFYCFSSEAKEDEYTLGLRLNTIPKAVYIQYGAFIAISLCSYNMSFVICVFPLFYTLPLIHHLLFRRAMRKAQHFKQ